MSFFKNLFGKSKAKPESDETQLHWINAADNQWGVKIVDLRPVTHNMIAMSSDPIMAQNSISYTGKDGTEFFGLTPKITTTIEGNIVIPIDGWLQPGVLFTPDTMDQKWAIYFDGENIIFIRSWLREVVVIAKTIQQPNQLFVQSITGTFTENERPEFTRAVLNFLLLSHSIRTPVPAPLPKELESDLTLAGNWAFSAYGNMAAFGIFDERFIPTTDKPLRSHSLLHIAVARGELDKIENFVQEGADINALAGDGMSPLHWSMAASAIESMEKLLELGADPNIRSVEGATPIMNAVQSNKIDAVILLINSGAEINAQDNRGFTALHRAAEMGHTEIVDFLLKNGADKTIVADGNTAMTFAAMRGREEVVRLLK